MKTMHILSFAKTFISIEIRTILTYMDSRRMSPDTSLTGLCKKYCEVLHTNVELHGRPASNSAIMLDISHTLVYSWHNEQNTANALTRISRRWCSWAANRESASRRKLTTLNPPESVSEKLTGSPRRYQEERFVTDNPG